MAKQALKLVQVPNEALEEDIFPIETENIVDLKPEDELHIEVLLSEKEAEIIDMGRHDRRKKQEEDLFSEFMVIGSAEPVQKNSTYIQVKGKGLRRRYFLTEEEYLLIIQRRSIL